MTVSWEVIKFLPRLADRLALAKAHSKLFKLIAENCCRPLIIDQSNVDLLKKNAVFCEEAAPHIRELILTDVKEDLHWIVPLCTAALVRLSLRHVNLTSEFVNSCPRNLKSFELNYVAHVAEDGRTQQGLARHFAQLVGIDHIELDCNIPEDTLWDCFERNKDTVKTVEDYKWDGSGYRV